LFARRLTWRGEGDRGGDGHGEITLAFPFTPRPVGLRICWSCLLGTRSAKLREFLVMGEVVFEASQVSIADLS